LAFPIEIVHSILPLQSKIKPLKLGEYLRNTTWKPECVVSFNMGWLILVFYPEPEARVKICECD
jgi:hypothetical protein